MLVCDGIQRARYRESNYRPSLLEAGKVYEWLSICGLPAACSGVDIAARRREQQ